MDERTDMKWWEGQWNQLKTELDRLNPLYDVALHRIKELEASLQGSKMTQAATEVERDRALAEIKRSREELDATRAELVEVNSLLASLKSRQEAQG